MIELILGIIIYKQISTKYLVIKNSRFEQDIFKAIVFINLIN